MPRSIDHIVIVVRDLDQASDHFTGAGFTVTPGGEHVGLGTHNSLVTFADGAYIELIAFKEPDKPHEHRWWSLLARGEGLVDFALVSDDLDADANAFHSLDVEAVGPFEMGRLRPDGQRVDWRLVVPPRDDDSPPLPFLIEDMTPRELRVPGGGASQHDLGVTGAAGVVIAVNDVARVGRTYQGLLGIDGESVASQVDGGANAVRFSLGAHWLELVEPASPESPVGQYVQTRGASPYELVLRGSGGDGNLLPLEQTRGARIRVVGA